MDCACTAPGFCPILKTKMVGRRFEICQGGVLTPEQCEAYRQKWLGEAGKPTTPPVSTDCVHRGAELEPVQCSTCKGKVMVKTFVCEIHNRCSLQKNVGEGIKVCKGCLDLSAPTLEVLPKV